MVFSSTVFMFIFLPLVLLVYYNPFFKGRKFKNVVLLISSLLFYAWGEPVFVFVMCFSIVLNWKLCILMDDKEGRTRRNYMLLMVIYDLGLLFIFKYLSFVTKNLGLLIHNDDIVVNIALPIGISFFIFETMSYVYDVYYHNCRAQKSLLNVALYISMFPQLVAGPIVRYSVVSDAIEMRTENSEDFYIGVKRFIYGLGKKVIIANNIAIAADKAFELCSGRDLSVSMAYVGVISYMLQLYFDFSGYSDMAIGLGRMFGFQFDENFNYPYISQSIAEYWRRWHISLGTWFKDYVMYPVMRTKSVDRLREFSKKKWGKKVSKIFPTIVGTAVVWLLEGIWHGANWTFVIFGIYHGCIIILYTIFRSRIKKFDDKYSLSEKKTIIALRIIRTMILVAVADVMFRADSLTDALYYYKVLLGAGTVDTQNYAGFYLWNYKYLLILGIVGCYPILPAIKRSNINKNAIAIGETVLLIGILLISISYLIRGTYNPFVYFNF
jgi:D-alanyl-lipoteichoic acid acyltransferase DltB (MBOAT superfamily)